MCFHERMRAVAPVAVLCAWLALPSLAAACTVSVGTLSFGSYDFRAGAPLDGVASLQIDCPAGVVFQVALERPGGAAPLLLQPAGGGRPLRYGLYVDAARSRPWGNGTGGTEVRGGTGGAPRVLQVYGRIPAGQTVNAGDYHDQVTVTVNW